MIMKREAAVVWVLFIHVVLWNPPILYAVDNGFVGSNHVDKTTAEWAAREIHVYGAVVDDKGMPVARAEILVSWQEYSVPYPGAMRKTIVVSDGDGLWEFHEKAMRASVREVTREGFLYERKQQDFGGVSVDDITQNRTSPTNRLVMRLHAIRNSTLLVTAEADLADVTTKMPLSVRYDIYRNTWLPLSESIKLTHDQFYPDIQIDVSFDESNGGWLVVFRAPASDGGIMATNTLLLESPDNGYHQEASRTVSFENNAPTYLYVRSRTPGLFTRFMFDYSLRPDSCVVSYEMAANPYGSRSFEPIRDIGSRWDVIEQLAAEARSEINHGGRPSKNDHDARLAESLGVD